VDEIEEGRPLVATTSGRASAAGAVAARRHPARSACRSGRDRRTEEDVIRLDAITRTRNPSRRKSFRLSAAKRVA
jgi:hypothetical protein